MPFGKARPWAAVVGAAVLLLAGCGSPPKDPDRAARAHPAADPPSRLCSIVGPPLIRQAVPTATAPAASKTIDQRSDAIVNRSLAQCELHGSGGSLLVTLVRYGPARDGSGPRRARGFFANDCGHASTGAPDERVGDQDCVTDSLSKAGHHFAVFYRSLRGGDELTVASTTDRRGRHPAFPTVAHVTELSRGMARNVWKAVA